jgi:PncC family amidohydrolase
LNGDLKLENAIVERLTALGQTVATAESCTGGLIAYRITDAPGSSACFPGGFVTYSNAAKCALVDVDPETLAQYGAVSEAVARQMAEGCRRVLGATWGIGVTGIAGPSGGTAEKPVGLVFIAVSGEADTVVSRNVFSGDRIEIREQSGRKALNMLMERLG